MTTTNPVQLLLANLGSFWTEVFTNDNEILDHIQSEIDANDQTLLDAANAIAAVSRFEIPVFRHRNWNKMVIATSELAVSNRVFYKLGDDISLGDPIELGQTRDIPVWIIKAPTNTVQITNIVDRPVSPTVVLSKGVDFVLENGNIIFFKNPAELGFTVTAKDVNGTPQQAVTLWLFNSKEDLKYIYNQFGFVVSLYAKQSTEHYKNLINAAFDNLIKSSNSMALRIALSSLVGIKVVQRQTETVQVINKNQGRLQIITDYDVYDFKLESTPIVAVGDVVHAGDIMVDSVQFYENANAVNAPITSLALDPEMFNMNLNGNLIFPNRSLNTTYSQDSSGFVSLRFPLGGNADDIETFWTYADTQGKATGKSVAQSVRLDSNSGQPAVNQVPSTINPMQFLIDKALQANITLIVIKVSELEFISGFGALVLLRRFIPPHVALFLCNEINAEIDYNEAVTEPGQQMLGVMNSVLSDTYSYTISETVDLIRIND